MDLKKVGFFGKQRIQRYQCRTCGRKISDIPDRPLDGLRVPLDKAAMILNLLVEGMSVRGCERLTGIHRDTVLRILQTAGTKCAALLEHKIKNIKAESVQIDECFTRVLCLQKHAKNSDTGDMYLLTAISRNSKLIIAHLVGKRTNDSAYELADQIRDRMKGTFQITSDGYRPYIDAIHQILFGQVHYAIQVKVFANAMPPEFHRYAQGKCTGVDTQIQFGRPVRELISTSHVERSNLSIRNFNKRFNRLTLGYSKTLENLRHASALYVAHFNFCRVHSAHGQTPAMFAGLTDRKWAITDLLQIGQDLPTLPA